MCPPKGGLYGDSIVQLFNGHYTSTGYSAYSPDLDGCVATGRTKEEVERHVQEAIEFHLQGMQHEGYTSPAPHSHLAHLEVPA